MDITGIKMKMESGDYLQKLVVYTDALNTNQKEVMPCDGYDVTRVPNSFDSPDEINFPRKYTVRPNNW